MKSIELTSSKSSTKATRAAAVIGIVLERLQAGIHVNADEILAEFAEFSDCADELRHVLPTMLALNELGAPVTQPSAASEGFELRPASWTLGDYRILGEVGRGGMGVVYKAEQISLARRVALKILPFAAVLDPRHLQRFKNEALAAAHLDHPNIVEVYGVGCERGVHFYAMRFVEGVTLAEVVRNRREAAGARPEENQEVRNRKSEGEQRQASTEDQRPSSPPPPPCSSLITSPRHLPPSSKRHSARSTASRRRNGSRASRRSALKRPKRSTTLIS